MLFAKKMDRISDDGKTGIGSIPTFLAPSPPRKTIELTPATPPSLTPHKKIVPQE
jgi:hypothetical protein